MKNFKLNQKEAKKFENIVTGAKKLTLAKWELSHMIQNMVDESEEINTWTGMFTKIAENNDLPEYFERKKSTVKAWSRYAKIDLETLEALDYSENQVKQFVDGKYSEVATFKAEQAAKRAAKVAEDSQKKQAEAEEGKPTAEAKNLKASKEFEAFKKSAAYTALEDFRYRNLDTFEGIMQEYLASLKK